MSSAGAADPASGLGRRRGWMGRSPSGIRVIVFGGAAILFLTMFPGDQALNRRDPSRGDSDGREIGVCLRVEHNSAPLKTKGVAPAPSAKSGGKPPHSISVHVVEPLLKNSLTFAGAK